MAAVAIPPVQLIPFGKQEKVSKRVQSVKPLALGDGYGSGYTYSSHSSTVQVPGTVEHKSVTVKLVLDHTFPYHDPVRGPRWTPSRDDVLDDALRTTEGEGSKMQPLQMLRHQNFMRGYRHLMPGAVIENGPGRDDLARPLPPKRRVPEPGESGDAMQVVL